ncbi:MAG: pyroglutamyl-peptidase I [Thermoplasmata archaeon]
MAVKVLITGFEPFLDFKTNPTQKMAKLLNKKERNGLLYAGRVLPVSYSETEDRLMEFIEEIKPELIIGMGLAPGRAKVSLEKIAINYKFSDEPDNSGRRGLGGKIDEKLEDGIFSLLNVEELYKFLNRSHIPTEISLTAGGYLCNYAMFVIVREARRLGIKGGFVHFPADTDLSTSLPNKSLPSMEMKTMVKAIEMIAQHEVPKRR